MNSAWHFRRTSGGSELHRKVDRRLAGIGGLLLGVDDPTDLARHRRAVFQCLYVDFGLDPGVVGHLDDVSALEHVIVVSFQNADCGLVTRTLRARYPSPCSAISMYSMFSSKKNSRPVSSTRR